VYIGEVLWGRLLSLYDLSDYKYIGSDKVFAIGLGTYNIKSYDKALDAFIYAITRGVNLIDTAEMYDSGRAEEFVGQIVKHVGRSSVFITTKILPSRLVDRDQVLKAAHESLRRLGVSSVDLILIHWPNENMSITEQVRNFEVVYEYGLARYIGVSNFDLAQLREAIEATRKAEIVVNQVHYSVLTRHYVEKELLPYCVEKGITLQAYTPLERGSVVVNPIIVKVARKYSKTPIQVALNYLISHKSVVAIPKSENINHVQEILSSAGWRLKVEDLEYIKKYA
jgi:diketogulonate reductase-like aldo/keto reductase